MKKVQSFRGAAGVAYKWRVKSFGKRPWNLRWKPVCASTERDLSEWLKEKPLKSHFPRAVIAARQTAGVGQRGRIWQAPIGGVWISAAFPFDNDQESAGILGLAVAVALAERLESCFVPVQIKWPNDLMVGGRKLAGFLPRLIHRGETLVMGRIGLGLNICNHVPIEGISLLEILKPKSCDVEYWTAEALLALDHAFELVKEAERVCIEAERLLWAKEVKNYQTGEIFQIEGIDINGALKLRNGSLKTVWNRWG